MSTPNQKVTPLDWRTKIVNPDGTPNNYFIRLWQTVYGNGDNVQQEIDQILSELAQLTAAEIQAGTGISITPDGFLLSNPTITLNAALGQLNDVDTAGATSGQVLGFDGSEWVPVDQSGGGGGSLPSLQAHAYWRILVYFNNGSTATSIAEVEMRPTPGGSDQCAGGTASASSTLAGYPASNAFNNDGGTTFWVSDSEPTCWLQYAFAAPVMVQEITMTSRGDGFVADNPKVFSVEYSDDGSNWNQAWGGVFTSAWTAGQTRTITNPDYDFSGGGGGGSGTVTSVDASGGTTGLTFSGGPITTSGTLTLAGTLEIANGGTGATTAEAARENLGAISHFWYPVFGGSGPIEPIYVGTGESVYVRLSDG